MYKRHDTGEVGEQQVVDLVPCPNCSKVLMKLPKNYPLYDVQCTGCSFRAQVKTSNERPKSSIFGAGWDIMEKVLKSGFMIPPMVVNSRWREGDSMRHEIRFYPFIPRKNLKLRILSENSKRGVYKMFNYIGLDSLPFFVLLKK